MGEAFDEFGGFFHNGKIGGKVGIEYIVKADLFEHTNHFWRGEGVGVNAEFFCPSNAYSRCDLKHGDDFRIGKGFHYKLGIVTFAKGAGWAVDDTLPTESAVSFADGAVIANVNGDAGTGAGNVPNAETLNFFTDLDAAHAFNALAIIADERRGHIPIFILNVFWEWVVEHVELTGKFLQGTVAVTHAKGAIAIVLRKNESQIGATGCTHTWAVGVNNHAFCDIIDTSRNKTVNAVNFNHAHTAGADFIESFPVAKAWYGMAGDFAGL